MTAVVLDIEGTVCPISFVKDVLFPYALKALPDVVNREWNREGDFQLYKDGFKELFPESLASPEAFIECVQLLSHEDSKTPPLKNLQGYLWKVGYHSGEIKAPIYEDAYEKIKEWHSNGTPVYIYSSGSIAAQKLLFAYTPFGDLNKYLSGYFDPSTVGPKQDPDSYKMIQDQIGTGFKILFLSDNVNELEAASKCGLEARLVERSGNAEVTDELKGKYSVLRTFKSL
ncbi:hypothetical protein CANCADRAFT_82247 [Tortispora caseinolytica NRRL Y-17796]|uniref:Enolase-phosphatase E1 n=1 Tax=Tortispora caseinolytica NRRL Y-17796 TaxID=767744 RepID=A0A1E4TK37_9ASCO|nr:hypothetical protein CANCADRAFT_82247 [Tortispora caseinolytica NRRL Y-17796]